MTPYGRDLDSKCLADVLRVMFVKSPDCPFPASARWLEQDRCRHLVLDYRHPDLVSLHVGLIEMMSFDTGRFYRLLVEKPTTNELPHDLFSLAWTAYL